MSVVIPARNAAATIGAQLGALAATSFDGMEVLVVDNGSTDDTAAVARAWADRLDLRVVHAQARANVGYARNVGIAHSLAEHVAICDADDEVALSWALAVWEALQTNWYVTGPLLLDRFNSAEVIAARGPRFDEMMPRVFGVVPFATGCNVGLRRELIRRIGWFREDMISGDDIELGLRAFEQGFECSFAPEAAIHYRLRSDLRGLVRQAVSYGTARPWLRRRCPRLAGAARDRVAMVKRVLWLVRRLPHSWRRAGRLRWLWTFSMVLGEVRGYVVMRSVPVEYNEGAIVGATPARNPTTEPLSEDRKPMAEAGTTTTARVAARLYAERPAFFPGNWALGEEAGMWLAEQVAGANSTLETGGGYSTIIFAASGAQHTCISPSEDEHGKIIAWCETNDVPIEHVTFVAGRSQDVLPAMALQPLDVVLIDGWHAFPVPILDWYHTASALRVGGIMVLDDDNLRPVRILHDFLAAEAGRWNHLGRMGHTSAFRKLVPDVVDTGEWSTQPFSARKLLTPKERARKAAFDLRAKLVSAQSRT